MADNVPFWSQSPEALCARLNTRPAGLTRAEAAARLETFGYNRVAVSRRSPTRAALMSQFRNPLILILIAAATLSFFLGDAVNSAIILAIVGLGSGLGFVQERGAHDAVARLIASVQVRATLRRDGAATEISVDDVVPGDIVELSAGSTVPGDGLLIEATSLYLDEAALTGESLPVAKAPGPVAAAAPQGQRDNAVFMGTHVVSGTGLMIVAATGRATVFGTLSHRLDAAEPETEFQRGLRLLGMLLAQVTLSMLAVVFGVNVFLHRPLVDSFLFALALAVGITPQLLPAIVTVNLSRGARRMAAAHVIVRRLFAIENFGRMDVLCCDKTGTLTEGRVAVTGAVGADGGDSPAALRAARINAAFESGFVNPIDQALRALPGDDLGACEKLGELPYDFIRKRLSILYAEAGERRLVTKGAVSAVLSICATAEIGRVQVPLDTVRRDIEARAARAGSEGLRCLAIAERRDPSEAQALADQETGLTFLGLLLLSDPVKADAPATVRDLARLGVRLKVISGDSRLVTAHVMEGLTGRAPVVVTGQDVQRARPEGLRRLVEKADCFAEIEPTQKEQIIRALRLGGHVVGFMGDGINDAAALHAADVGLSVDTAVDVAKEAADIVLLDRSLSVIGDAIHVGRTTYANTLKYVFMAVGTNLGNVFSMAIASLMFPFLPLLPKQILFANLLTDLPAMAISTDRVDAEMVARPRRWNMAVIERFIWVFGPVSSVFDMLTFALLVLGYHASPALFRTGWFVESVVSAVLVVLALRSRRPAFQSRPSPALFSAILAVAGVGAVLPWTPFAAPLGLVPLPPGMALSLLAIVAVYLTAVEGTKRVFYRHAPD